MCDSCSVKTVYTNSFIQTNLIFLLFVSLSLSVFARSGQTVYLLSVDLHSF